MSQLLRYPPSAQVSVPNPLPVTDVSAEASLTSIDSKTPTEGQKTMAGSSPVVIASDQSAIPVTISGGIANPLPVQDSAAETSLADLDARLAGSLTPVQFDETVLTYVGSTTQIATAVFKLAGVTKKTLTMTYDGSNRLIDVVAS